MALEEAPAGANNAFTRNHTESVTIAAAGTTSEEFIIGGRGVVTIHLPTMDACYISYLVKINPGDTAVVLVDDSNSTLTFPRGSSATVTTARVYQEPRLSGVYSVQIVSSASQGSDRVIGISARGQNPIPTITDIEATLPSGATITVNQITAATSNGYGTQTAVTRAANMTPYTANDVVGGAIDLGVMGPSAGQIIITSSLLEPRIAAVPTGMTSFTLYLYSVTPPSAIADNGAWTLASGDLASYLGSIALGTPALPAASSAALIVEQANLGKQVKLAGTHLFGYLVTAGGYTPAGNSEVYELGLQAVAI